MNRHSKPSMRLFVDAGLDGATLDLDAEQAHYLGRVLRCREGDRLVVFNGQGAEKAATVTTLGKRLSRLALDETVAAIPEPSRRVTLLQALVKSDAMDLIVQKATELGVAQVVAVKTDFSVVRLDADRRERRLDHWRRIATSACEQSGRHRPPELVVFDRLDAAIDSLADAGARFAFTLDEHPVFDAAAAIAEDLCVAIGPEGGFSPDESGMLARAGFALRSLGPRTLRAETAAIAVCASLSIQAAAVASASRCSIRSTSGTSGNS